MTGRRGGTAALTAVLVIGVGLVAAPFAFRMFGRAPQGGEMLDDFRPYMTAAQIAEFRGYLDEIDAAAEETTGAVVPAAETTLDLGAGGFDDRFVFVADFAEQWPAIHTDMGDMLTTMDENLGNYRAVDALPPFVLFPWFFAVPGVLVAGLAAAALASRRAGRPAGGRVVALVVLGVGLVAAPIVFQMFTRAPAGNDMIDEFRSLMTRDRVVSVQGYFVTIGNGEGELRNQVLPALSDPSAFPAVDRFVDDWPTINNEFAPMIGTMSDNVDNFGAVDALPPFALFPWFFLVPGVLVAALALAARSRLAAPPAPALADRRSAERVSAGGRPPTA